MNLTPKNWAEFQHYKDRSPVWIKLHRRLLDDFEFHCLPDASKALAPLLWLLASEYEDGVITASVQKMAYRFRKTEGEILSAIKPLIEAGFFVASDDASEALAECKPKAILEKRRDRDREEGECADARRPVKKDRRRATQLPDGFSPNFDKATSAGLSRAEADIELMKFRNHAVERGRTCVDWQAAWHNWCLKAAEFKGRKPSAEKSATPAIPNEFAVRMFREVSRWHPDYGPSPDQPGCRAPKELLEKYGYLKTEAA